MEPNGRRPPARRISRRTAGLAIAVVVLASLLAGILYTAFSPRERISVAANSVAGFDPRTGEPTADLAAGVEPRAVAVGDGSLWVGNDDDRTVSQLDPAALELVRTISLGVYPSDVTVGEGGVWLVSGPTGRVIRLHPRRETVSLGYTCGRATRIAAGAGSLWVACGVAPGVLRIDLRTRSAKPLLPPPQSGLADAAFGLGALWLADRVHDEVLEVDPATHRVARAIRVGHAPVALAVGAGAVWVAGGRSGILWRITHGTAQPIAVGQRLTAVAASASGVWVVDDGDHALDRIDPRTRRVVVTVKLSERPVGLALGSDRLWVTIQSK